MIAGGPSIRITDEQAQDTIGERREAAVAAAEAQVTHIRQSGGTARAYQADVSDPAAMRNDADITSGISGALLERGYFQAPQQQFNVSCRLQMSVFDKTRLTEVCN